MSDSHDLSPHRFVDCEGVNAPSSPDGRSGFIDDVVVDLGLASRESVDEAVEKGRMEGKMPVEILVETGVINDEQLAQAIAERNGLPYVDLFTFKVDDGAARLIDPDTARRYRAMPIAFDADGAVVVALADPLDALAVSDIGVITKSEVRTAVGSDAGMEAILATLPPSKRPARLSAHGPDGFAGGRAADDGAWSLAQSISTPESTGVFDPPLETRAPEPAADLGNQIDSLVAAALEKHLGAGSSDESRLAKAEAEAIRWRDEAEQAHAEIELLNQRIAELEGRTDPVGSARA